MQECLGFMLGIWILGYLKGILKMNFACLACFAGICRFISLSRNRFLGQFCIKISCFRQAFLSLGILFLCLVNSSCWCHMMQCVGCSKAPGVCLRWVWWSQGCCRCYSCTRWLVSSFLFTPPMSDPLTTASTLVCFNLTSFRLSLWCKNHGFLCFALCPVLIVHTCLLLLSLNQQFVKLNEVWS